MPTLWAVVGVARRYHVMNKKETLTMTDKTMDNIMGLDGFEFVEYAAPERGILEPVFELSSLNSR